jgi:alginate O-acetyltransferase complex protein AlgI
LRSLEERPNWHEMGRGVYFFVGGMCQKILLADLIAAKINPQWHDVAQLQFFASWYSVLGYTCQLYFDFAAYSNMAVGLGLLLGFRFPQNFDSPYKSASISEFWRRWHMTLSFFLRDYLFIPLGGSRCGHTRTLRNLMIVMLLGGLWHGAGWTFVLWGAYHGMLLVIHAVYSHRDLPRIPRPAAITITFLAVVVGWVLFRATDLSSAIMMLQSMCGLRGFESQAIAACGGAGAIALLALLLAICFAAPNLWQIRFRPNLASAVGLSAALVVCVLRFSQESPFLYFQF